MSPDCTIQTVEVILAVLGKNSATPRGFYIYKNKYFFYNGCIVKKIFAMFTDLYMRLGGVSKLYL
ncbi:hypothetical protein BpHYR1_044331 [Brachionus plicatilis]|uniref:Uncharacterized protein n=1 Tax=Brachionus plicatilis TaxID=10195 RepID=A0A3M7RSM3_BRAPC|nr:hypothetical protein BpHYR1_044331 [Brachionus plicatilis]